MKYEDHAFNHPHFCMYDNSVPVKLGYMKVLKEGESEYRVVELFFYLWKCTFPYFFFGKCVIMKLSGLKDVQRKGAQPPRTSHNFKKGS